MVDGRDLVKEVDILLGLAHALVALLFLRLGGDSQDNMGGYTRSASTPSPSIVEYKNRQTMLKLQDEFVPLHCRTISYKFIHVDHDIVCNILHLSVYSLKNERNGLVGPTLLLDIHMQCILRCPHTSHVEVDRSLPNNLARKPQLVLLHCITKAKEHNAKPMLPTALRNPLFHVKQRKLY